MKNFNFKERFSPNLISAIGWVCILYYCVILLTHNTNENNIFGLFFVSLIAKSAVLCILLLICLGGEIIVGIKVKNNFILNNKIYNIIWSIGFICAIIATMLFLIGLLLIFINM